MVVLNWIQIEKIWRCFLNDVNSWGVSVDRSVNFHCKNVSALSYSIAVSWSLRESSHEVSRNDRVILCRNGWYQLHFSIPRIWRQSLQGRGSDIITIQVRYCKLSHKLLITWLAIQFLFRFHFLIPLYSTLFNRPIIDDIPMSAHEDGNSTFSSESFHTEPGFDEKLAGKYLIAHHRIFTWFLSKIIWVAWSSLLFNITSSSETWDYDDKKLYIITWIIFILILIIAIFILTWIF